MRAMKTLLISLWTGSVFAHRVSSRVAIIDQHGTAAHNLKVSPKATRNNTTEIIDGPQHTRPEGMVDFATLKEEMMQLAQKVAEDAVSSGGFVFPRGEGRHILFNPSEVEPYFHMIRTDLGEMTPVSHFIGESQKNGLNAQSTNEEIFHALMQSMQFNGIDFEHRYSILPHNKFKGDGLWPYTFAESIVLGHVVLIVPTMQHYGPLQPNLPLGVTNKFEDPTPLLVVGMIGDCVKGTSSFFQQLSEVQKEKLRDPERLVQKMRATTRYLLQALHKLDPDLGMQMDATLVGAGAFGGVQSTLAPEFVKSVNGLGLSEKDEVSFFMYPKPAEWPYHYNLNPLEGLGGLREGRARARVAVIGFDPISITPHAVLNRALSGEGQVGHATDLLFRLTGIEGTFKEVVIPEGRAWTNGAAYFGAHFGGLTGMEAFKEVEQMGTVRFIPTYSLEGFGLELPAPELVELEEPQKWVEGEELFTPRVWNNDAFDGWRVKIGSEGLPLWIEAING